MFKYAKVVFLLLNLIGPAFAIAQTSPSVFRKDIISFYNALHTQWANKQRHEVLEQVPLPAKTQTFLQDIQSKNLTVDQDSFVEINRFANSLNDGHLWVTFPQAKYLSQTSNIRVAEGEEGLLLISCSGCGKLSLPRIISKINDAETDVWIKTQSALLRGSTQFGKQYAAVKSLEKMNEVHGLAELPARITILDAKNNERVVPLRWTDVPNAPPATETKCVSSKLIEKALVISVKTFYCAKEEGTSLDENFRKELEAAMEIKSLVDFIVIDVRGNSGGMPVPAKTLAGYFIDAPILWFAATKFPDGFSYNDYAEPRIPQTKWEAQLKSKPLWLLTDGGCFSQCSVFTVALADSGRAKIIGTPIDAGTGSVADAPWIAPSGLWSANIPPWRAQRASGEVIEGSILVPDVQTKPPRSLFLQNEDPFIRNALNRIKINP